MSLLLFEELLEEDRGELEDDDELEEAVLLLGDEVLIEDEERGELEDAVLLLEEDCEELLL